MAGPSGPAFLYNFYPRSPCGERPAFDILAVSALLISIHALLAESDCEGVSLLRKITRFLSTLSLRRATDFHSLNLDWILISIHALLAESDLPAK